MRIQFINVNTQDRDFNDLFTLLSSDELLTVTQSNKYEEGHDFYIINGNISDQLSIKISNKPIVLYITKNTFVDDIESFVYNKDNKLDWLYKTSLVTHIWIQSQYDEYKVYLETLYKIPVVVVPFFYFPLKLELDASLSSSQLKNESIIDIVLYETNESFNQSSFKLLFICQEFYKRFPSKLGTVYLLNLPINETALKLIESTDLWKDKKLRKFAKLPDTDILSYFKKSPNNSIFLSNTLLPHINQFMYDIISNNLYLAHTQKTFPYGLYYDVNNVELCIDFIKDASDFFIKYVSKHKNINIQGIEKYTTDTVKPFYRSYFSKYHMAPINIHEQMCENKGDISKPLVITYDNCPTENTKFYINTLKNNKWEYILIGKDEKWEGWITRMRAYLSILKTLDPNKVVLLTDARDVICCRSATSFMDAFNYYKSDLIVCMELICDNLIEQPDDYIGAQCHPIRNYWKHHNISTPRRQFVNNGLIAGKAHKLIELLQYGIDNKFKDDQKALGSFINTFPQGITTDIHAELFHTSCFGVYSGLLDQRLQSDDSPTFAEIFGRSAFFLHIPGIANIKGARVVYNTTKSLIEAGISDELLRYGYTDDEPKWIPRT